MTTTAGPAGGEERPPVRRRRTAVAANAARNLVYLILLVAPVAGAAAAADAFPRTLAELDPPAEPVWASPTASETRDDIDVVVTVDVGDAPTLKAPDWATGVITAVNVTPGATIEEFDQIATVGQTPIIAAHTPSPFSRDLTIGSSGADVVMLQELLGRAGVYDGTVDGKYGSVTGGAVKDWRTALGDPNASTAFDHTQIIWMPDSTFAVADTILVVAVPAPAAGTDIISANRDFVAATLTGEAAAPVRAPAGYTLRVDGTTDLGPVIDQLDRSQLDALATAYYAGTIAETTINGQASPSGTLRFTGTLEQDQPTKHIAVPGSAIIHGTGDLACVVIGPQSDLAAVRVTVTGSNLTTVFLDPSTAPAGDVLVNPVDVGLDVQCA